MRTIPESQDRAIGAARDLDRTGSDCYLIEVWVINSVVECVLHTDEVTGSNPVSPTSVYLQASPETSSGLASLFPTLPCIEISTLHNAQPPGDVKLGFSSNFQARFKSG